MKNATPSPNLFRVLLGVYILASLSYWVAGVQDNWMIRLHPDQFTQDAFEIDNDTGTLTSVQHEAGSVGLAKGDRIETLNGVPYTGLAQLAEVTQTPGDSLEVGVKKPDGSEKTAEVVLQQSKPSSAGTAARVQEVVLLQMLPLICLLIGYWVVAAKPLEPNAWLLLGLLTFPEVVFMDAGSASGLALLLRGLFYEFGQLVGPLLLLPFGLYFPERSRIDVKAPWLKWLVLGPAALGALVLFYGLSGEFYRGGNPPSFVPIMNWAGKVINFLNLMCVILYLIIVLDKLRTASTADARRRLRVLFAGTSVGLVALLVAFVLLPRLGLDVRHSGKAWLAYLGAGLFMIAPLTLAYVVLVQRAMDVRILLRMGTRYALARASLYVLQGLLLALIAVRVIRPMMEHRPPGMADQISLAGLVIVVLLLRFGGRKRLQSWMDRKFFRETYDAELVLRELSDQARMFTETQPLLETVARRVGETLHVEKIAMLLRRGEFFQLQQSIGVQANGTLALAVHSSTVRNLTNTNSPAKLYRDDPDAWYLMADDVERRALDMVNAELLLPLPGRNRLMGVMALGPKRSEAAYSRSDLHLLQMVAAQTGLALEVSELAHSLATAAAQRERTNREMEIAREVQERLFPQAMPHLQGANVAGRCRPALGVGGDYYDLIELSEGRVGLALGDVSGKGISAALLMASLRASLRGLTMEGPKDFAKLMHKVNRLVFEASATNRYATFFFAAYDPATRLLECVNAGHNPPLLLRSQPGGRTETIRLEAGGPVVGLLPDAPYVEQTLIMESGDLLVMFTDGISEAMSIDDEEWGEDRLEVAALAARTGSAEQVIKAIFDETDVFTKGAEQHDDMTLLVLRLD
jgi:sigma-B regulation protein RsbU (phosphoserine phosphatase)